MILNAAKQTVIKNAVDVECGTANVFGGLGKPR